MNTICPPEPGATQVRELFDSLASRYDLFNRLTSMGLDQSWRRRAVEGIAPGMRVLDLGCGTGDLALACAVKAGPRGSVLGIDFSGSMLEIARRRSKPDWINLRFKIANAEDLPLAEEPFDAVVSAFVLRNLYGRLDRVLAGVRGSLRPFGHISFLDITEPEPAWLKQAWRLYMRTAVRLCGRALFGGDYPETYVTDSAARFFKPAEMAAKLKERGFGAVRVSNLFLGIITLYEAENSR